MGLNLDDLWGQAKDAINKSLEDVKRVGVPAITSAAEKWGADVLQQQKDQLLKDSQLKDKELQSVVKDIQARPATPGSFGSFFSETIMGAGLGANGVLIVLGLAAVVGLGIYLGKK